MVRPRLQVELKVMASWDFCHVMVRVVEVLGTLSWSWMDVFDFLYLSVFVDTDLGLAYLVRIMGKLTLYLKMMIWHFCLKTKKPATKMFTSFVVCTVGIISLYGWKWIMDFLHLIKLTNISH